jgi:UDP-N-acetylglucosamine 1-carboxyvinyltransferase
MDRIIIRGGNRLSGRLPISGAKNSALTLLPCALLTDEPLTLRNLPRLADIDGFQHLMNQFGVSTTIAGARPEDFGRVMTLEATGRITSSVAPYDWCARCAPRSSCSGRCWRAWARRPCRCPAAARSATARSTSTSRRLEAFGAHIELAAGYVRASAPGWRPARRRYVSPSCLGRRDRKRADGGLHRQAASASSTTPRASRKSSTCAGCSSRWARKSRASEPIGW